MQIIGGGHGPPCPPPIPSALRNVGLPETDRNMFLFFTFNQRFSIRAFSSRDIKHILLLIHIELL